MYLIYAFFFATIIIITSFFKNIHQVETKRKPGIDTN